ncbi:MAG: hypothetical protein HXX10_15975 [Rhodoplanes sp.]|uniref:hypothetical protein n=1 Tax=Rhodoplanes sp. TaxID=1968906 RepID=UPI0017ACB580|nr:hypothetical protein [Rhodoplanes sp.]NVO15529.1 hypothetical protein [Rhodoplanes sp.]
MRTTTVFSCGAEKNDVLRLERAGLAAQSRRMATTRLSPAVLPGLAARVAATVRALLARDAEEGVFLVTLGGRVHGVLRRGQGGWRLGWLDCADPRLAAIGDVVAGDVAEVPEALEAVLRRRLDDGDETSLRVTPVLAF